MRPIRLLAFFLILGAMAGAGAYFAMPLLTLQKIDVALKERSSQQLDAHINYRLLRQNLKDQLRGPARGWLIAQGRNQLEKLAAGLLGGIMVDPIVDYLVSPDGLNMLVHGKSQWEDIQALRDEVEKSEPDALPADPEAENRSFAYKSLSEFHLSVSSGDDPPVTLVLNRQGLLDWKLTNILLPVPDKT